MAALLIAVGAVFLWLAMVVRFLVEGRLEKRRDRRRWQEIDSEAKAFREELDRVDLSEEMREWGRAV
jgi:hypothetical protein